MHPTHHFLLLLLVSASKQISYQEEIHVVSLHLPPLHHHRFIIIIESLAIAIVAAATTITRLEKYFFAYLFQFQIWSLSSCAIQPLVDLVPRET